MSNINNYQNIYISGKISDLPFDEVKLKFEKAEEQLKNLGYIDIVNPLKLQHKSYHIFPLCKMPLEWSDYMRTDIIALCSCNAIYILNNWTKSKGARLEVNIASALNLELLFEL